MAKSGDGKGKAGETAVEKKLHEYAVRAQEVGAEAASEIDPIDVQTRGQNVLIELAEARANDEPQALQWVDDERTVTWEAIIDAQIEHVRTETTKPGGLASRPPPVPKEERIQTANELAETARKRVETAVEPNKWEKSRSASLRQQIFGERPVPSSRAGWITEMSSIRTAIAGMGSAAPAALVKLLPRVDEALAALDGSKAQQAGRPRSPAYAPQVLEAAVALDLMLGDVRAWASSQATDKRYGAIVRAVAPRRRTDAKSEAGSKGDGAGSGASGSKGDGAGSSASGSTGSTGSAGAGAQEPKNGAAAPPPPPG